MICYLSCMYLNDLICDCVVACKFIYIVDFSITQYSNKTTFLPHKSKCSNTNIICVGDTCISHLCTTQLEDRMLVDAISKNITTTCNMLCL